MQITLHPLQALDVRDLRQTSQQEVNTASPGPCSCPCSSAACPIHADVNQQHVSCTLRSRLIRGWYCCLCWWWVAGTVSGPEDHERGCLFEITWGGKNEVSLGAGAEGQQAVQRVYLEDGDQVVFRGRCEGGAGGVPGIGFGECRGQLLPCAYKAAA